MFKKLIDAILDTEVTKLYMSFHWCVLIALWVACFYQLARYEFGNALCLGVVIAAWKMKGVEE